MEEVEAIQNGLLRYQERMLRATELRSKMTSKLTGKIKELTGRVEEKRDFKSQKIENDYIAEFTKNVTKREKMEE
jgi:adenylyl- and sulfurtransferase ThiI